jgi:phospholipase C
VPRTVEGMSASHLRVLITVTAVLAGCGTAPSSTLGGSLPARSPAPATATAASASQPTQPVRVVVIVMENRGYDQVVGLPYISGIATAATTLTSYHAVSHPSLPNYLALTSGSTWGITDDGYHPLPRQDIGDQLTSAGMPWRAYMEGMGSNCLSNTGGYAVKHNPFAYYGGSCPSSVTTLAPLAGDLSSATAPRLTWITPDLCHDMHDCSSSSGDQWLRGTVPALLASPAMSNGVLFVTWDENDGGADNRVLTVVLGSRRPVTPAARYTHVDLLATVQDLLGVSRLPGTAASGGIALR